jgi:hypothetical protein
VGDVQGVMEDTRFDHESRFSVFPLLFVHFYLCTRVGGCGNMYPYTVTDDRVGRSKKRKDNGKEFFRRDCMRNFSYHETLLSHLCSENILE